MAQLDTKESYAELTDKQQAVVDEIVEDPTAQNTEIAERAGVARSTVYNVKEHYNHIVESRLNARGRHDGTEETVGDPFAALAEDVDPDVQFLSERPHQPGASNGETDADTDGSIQLVLSERDVREILVDGSTKPIQEKVLRQVVDRAFAV